MYWREHFADHQSAARALHAHRTGRRPLPVAKRLAAEHALSGLDGGLKSLLKKAKQISPSHYLAKKIAPKLYKKIEKIEPAGLLNIKSSPKTAAVAKPATIDTPIAAPPAPVNVTTPDYSQPMQFAQGSGGGGGLAPAASPDATDSGLSMPVMIGIGVGALALLYLMTRKR